MGETSAISANGKGVSLLKHGPVWWAHKRRERMPEPLDDGGDLREPVELLGGEHARIARDQGGGRCFLWGLHAFSLLLIMYFIKSKAPYVRLDRESIASAISALVIGRGKKQQEVFQMKCVTDFDARA